MPRFHPDDSPKIENAASQAVVVHRPRQGQHQPPSGRGRSPNLLDLPTEIRLKIYKYVLESNPFFISQDRLPKIKSSRVQTICACTCTPFRPRIMTETRLDNHPIKIMQRDSSSTSPMFTPRRPQGYFPIGLLGACHQIYAEVRTLPFSMNDWAFGSTNVEDSGLIAASFFTRTLVPWQRDAMRWARLNVSSNDFDYPDRLRRWEELCGFWGAGLRGLRLHVSDDLLIRMHRGSVWREPWAGDGDQWRWVDGGLQRLRGLKTVEVEWVGRMLRTVTKKERLTWCERVSERLNEGRDECEKTAVVAIV